jgi:hypothetical protein
MQKLTPKERLKEIFDRYRIPHNKQRADNIREYLAIKVWEDRDEKEHRKSDDGQSTEK